MLASVLASSLLLQDLQLTNPRVFRAVFEDRPRQLIILLPLPGRTDNLGFVFHPDIGAVRKIWLGSADYRGKVYDFSQNNSRADGKVLWEAPSECIRLPDSPQTEWISQGMEFDKGWKFVRDGAYLESPPFRYDGLQTAYIGFDELSERARLQFTLTAASGKIGTSFGSSTAQDSNWQWNYKNIPVLPGEWKLRVSAEKAADNKAIRNLRVFGDFPAWHITLDGKSEVAPAHLTGYRINDGIVTVIANVAGAQVEWTPGISAQGWTETFRISGLPANATLADSRMSLNPSVKFANGTQAFEHPW